MNTQSDIPHTHHHPDASDALVSIHQAALQNQADSFPVLKAFQDYLEAERGRARRRMIWMSGFFLFTLILVIGGMLTAGILAFNHYTRSVDRLQSVLVQSVLQPERRAAPVDDQTLNAFAESVQARLAQRMEQVDSTVASLDQQTESYRAEMLALRTALDAMQATNRLLHGEMQTAQGEWPQIASNLAATAQWLAEARQTSEVATVAPSPTVAAAVSAPVAENRVVSASPVAAVPARVETPLARSAPPIATTEPGTSPPTPPGYREVGLWLASPQDVAALPWVLLLPE